MEQKLNFEADLKIDPEALDVEWLDQPSRYFRYSRELARLNQELADMKLRGDVARAELDSKVRANPEKYGIVKITEAQVNAAIEQAALHQNAAQMLNEKTAEVAVAQAAVRAFEQRKSSLENLVRLCLGNYFSGPSVPRDLKEEFERSREKADEADGLRTRESVERRQRKGGRTA